LPATEAADRLQSRKKAADDFGRVGFMVGHDSLASSAITLERLGWRPVRPGLIADLERRQILKSDSTNRRDDGAVTEAR